MVVTTCFVLPTTCFGMPTNETKGMMHYSGLKGTPVQIQHVAKIFFCLKIKKFWYTCEKDKFNDVNKHFFDKMYWQKKKSNF